MVMQAIPDRVPVPQEAGSTFYESLVDSLPFSVYRIDRDGHVIFANSAFLDILGVDRDVALGRSIYDFFPKRLASEQRQDDERILTTGLPIDKIAEDAEEAGGPRHYRREMKLPVGSPAGDVVGVQGILWDVTEQMRAQADLRESEERFNLFMDTLPAAVFIKSEDSTTLYCNRYMADIIGARNWRGKSVRDHFPPELAEKMIADDRRSIEAGYIVTEEHVPNADGQIHLYQTHKFAIPREGLPPLLGGIALDITERKQAEVELQRLNAQLKVLATTDQLTGLMNRRHLTDILDQEARRMVRYGKGFSVILMDIDHFKSVNDRHGHQAGDEVLVQISGILAGHVRAVDSAGRWGGEEFLVICPETTLDGAANLAELMRQRIEQHDFAIPAAISASFGVAASQPSMTAEALMKAADDALYRAKAMGRNRVVSTTQ